MGLAAIGIALLAAITVWALTEAAHIAELGRIAREADETIQRWQDGHHHGEW